MTTYQPEQEPATYPGICFNETGLSPKTIFDITDRSVFIYDPTDGYRYTFPGGRSGYEITITDAGPKKHPYKNIIIKKLIPFCPISKMPVIEPEMARTPAYAKSPDCGLEFKPGFAFNCYQINMRQHSKFELHPALYCKIGFDRPTACDVYLVVPIIDKRKMLPDQIDALMDGLGNMDVVRIISSYYEKLNEKDFNFQMADTPIMLDTLYHKRGLVELFQQGKLKLGIVSDNLIGLYGYSADILILEPDAFNHVSPFGKESYLKYIFNDCEEMMGFRKQLIEKYLA